MRAHRGARALALTAITLAITITVFVIVQHDRPFVGTSAISPAPILWASGVEQ